MLISRLRKNIERLERLEIYKTNGDNKELSLEKIVKNRFDINKLKINGFDIDLSSNCMYNFLINDSSIFSVIKVFFLEDDYYYIVLSITSKKGLDIYCYKVDQLSDLLKFIKIIKNDE